MSLIARVKKNFRWSTFHPHAQRNAFRHCDAHLQSRSFARWNRRLRPRPNPIGPFEIGEEVRKIHFLLLVRSDLLRT